MNEPLHVWTYWEGPRPPYIDACIASMARACDVPGVEFHFLTPHNLGQYLEEGVLHPNSRRMLRRNMPANCIRAALLAKYGGWWWDADTVGLSDPLALTKCYPDASMLYMTWSLPPRRILNGYIYARPGCDVASEWLRQVNHKIEHHFEQANVWLELGEKILTPLLEGRADCQEIERRLFLPIDIDKEVTRFFEPGDPGECIQKDTVCFGMNHSWFHHNRKVDTWRMPRRMRSSPLLFHRLMHRAQVQAQAGRAQPRIAVVTLATGDYWKGAEVLFRSLQSHGMPDSVDRIVLSNDEVECDFARRVPITRNYKGVKTKDGQFAQTANKFAALTLDYDRIVLIDSDIFCVQDPNFLWSKHLDGEPFWAVQDSATWKYYGEKIASLGMDRNLMFNAGVMVYNRPEMPDLHEQLLKAIQDGWCKSYDGGDQGYLNHFFQGIGRPVRFLPSGYNYLLDPNMPQLPEYARYLFHFAGAGLKPWHPGFTRKATAFRPYVERWQKEAAQPQAPWRPARPRSKRVAMVYLNNDKYVSRGPGYVVAAAMEAGHEVDFFDTAYKSVDAVTSDVASGSYDVVCLSASSLFYHQATRLATTVKQRSSATVLLGGIHATIAKGTVLEECPAIDYICVGEGEEFVVEFLGASSKDAIEAIDNLGYRGQDGQPVVNPVRPPTDINKLPPFPYHLFPQRAVVQDYPRPGFCYVWATRGCPYRCTYCCNTCYLDLYGKKYLRTRAVDQTIDDLLYLRDHYPVKLFYFGDEMMFFDKKHIAELFPRVQSEVQRPYGIMARVEAMTPDTVDLLRRTGCVYAALGIECGNEKFRREFLNRRMTNQQIVDGFGRLRQAIPHIFLTSFNMRGYPVPYDDQLLEETKALNAKIRPNHVQTSMFFPFPGTKLHDYCVENDLIDQEELRRVYEDNQEYFSKSVLKAWSEGAPC